MDAWGTVEGIHLQSRIIGEHPTVELSADTEGFETGIFEKRSAGFLDVRAFGTIRHIEHGEAVTEEGANFRRFMRVAGGENQSRRNGHGGGVNGSSILGEVF